MVTFRLIKNTTLGGVVGPRNFWAEHVAGAVRCGGQTITGGTVVYVTKFQKADSRYLDLDALGIEFGPGDTLTVAAESAAIRMWMWWCIG